MQKKNKPKGGRREGAGRPANSGKYKEQTVTIRIPLSLVPKVLVLLDKLERKVNK